MRTAIDKARAAGEYQWALELLDRLIAADQDRERAIMLKAEVLRAHADAQINCPTRHDDIQSCHGIDRFQGVILGAVVFP